MAAVLEPDPTLSVTPTEVLWETVVPPGARWSHVVKRGTILRVEVVEPTSGVACLAYNADDTSERLNVADTVKIQWGIRLGANKVLYSDMGRVLYSIVSDTCGWHDTIVGGSTASTNMRKYGSAELNSSRENLLILAGRHGLSRRDVGPCVSLFSRVDVQPDGALTYVPGVARPGDFVDLRAEMNVLTLISNCPHPLSPEAEWKAGAVKLSCRPAGVVALDDAVRTASAEATRGFENTEAFYA